MAATLHRESWYPNAMFGRLVVLRRHRAEDFATFARWYNDPEVARLSRHRQTPLSNEEQQRFFHARITGGDSLAMAIHIRATEQLIGTCAFTHLDGENGSALYHITIGERSGWGHGYGTEATQLMVGHAFGQLGLHRVSLTVFEFNERAIRAYLKAGFQIEGRGRQALFRDGRFWDEIYMSVLSDEWAQRPQPLGRQLLGR